jgi:hypothetical protein
MKHQGVLQDYSLDIESNGKSHTLWSLYLQRCGAVLIGGSRMNCKIDWRALVSGGLVSMTPLALRLSARGLPSRFLSGQSYSKDKLLEPADEPASETLSLDN